MVANFRTKRRRDDRENAVIGRRSDGILGH
jgi:hypothetical protein